MRLFLIAALVLVPHCVLAQTAGALKPDKLRDSNQMPLKMPSQSRNPCAEYGAGFAPVAGTSTCARIGGSVGVGVGTSNGAPASIR